MLYDNLIKFYYKIASAYKWKILVLFLFAIVWCTAETIAPYLIKIIIDDLSSCKNNANSFIELLGISILYYFFLILIIEIALRWCNYILMQISPDIRGKFRDALLDHLLKKSIGFYQNHFTGELVTKFKNLSNSFNILLTSFLYGIFPVFISSLLIISFLFYIEKSFAVFFIAWFLGMNLVTFYFARKSISLSNKRALHENMLLGHIGDLFKNILSIKIFQGETLDIKITNRLQKLEIENAKKLEWLTFKIDSIRSIISIIIFLLMIVMLGFGWTEGEISLGDFSFVTATCFYIRRSLWIASLNLLTLFREIGIAKEAFNDLVVFNNFDISISKRKYYKKINYDINVDSICFGYNKNNMQFKHLTLYIPEGQKIFIMGASGSGKTTLMKLILKILPIKSGKILIGGTINNCNEIAYIPQHTEMFHRSVLDNILYGNPEAKMTEVIRVARFAEIDKFIMTLAHGYDTLVGENGVKLSGGQCQRILLARALLKKPKILILDESTSALDKNMEKIILQNLIDKIKIKTLIMVSHNCINLKLFDRAILFEKGLIEDDYLIKSNYF